MSHKVCVIGYGYLGKWHCDKVVNSPYAQLTCIVEPFDGLREQISTKHPGVFIAKTVDEAIAHADVFFIITPTSTHLDIFKKLIKHDKHVFCEKPFSDDLEKSLITYSLMANYKSKVAIGHSERCHQAWEVLDFKDGLKHLELRREAPFKDRALDVSVIDDLMIHDIDLIHFLTSSPIQKVRARGVKKREDQYGQEFIEVFGETESGVNLHIIADRDSVFPQRTLLAHGSTHSFKVDLGSLEIINHREKIKYDKRDHLQFEHDHFYQAINNDTEVFSSLEDGLLAMSVVDAIKQSLETNSEVIVEKCLS